jgi:hypothetical protein
LEGDPATDGKFKVAARGFYVEMEKIEMKLLNRTVRIVATALCLALPVAAHSADKMANQALMVKALQNTMTPGEAQKRLNSLVGTFSVKMKIWVTPTGAPEESMAASVCNWVLGERYVQCMLSENAPNAPFSGAGYIAYDNASKNYQAAWMDTGSTGITLYTGKIGADRSESASSCLLYP